MTHNWKIYDLKRTLSDNVVTTITYACESNLSGSATREIGELTVSGSTSDPGFITYENLTQETVLGWVTGSIDTTSFETKNSASLAAHINKLAAITEINGTPWE